MSEPLFRVRGLKVALPDMTRKSFFGTAPKVEILRGLDFELPRNSVTGIVGESGSGKSTLGRALVRLNEPTEGSVEFDGRDITHLGEDRLKPLRRDLQMIFQDPMSSLNPRRTIAAIIAAPLKKNGVTDNLEGRVAEALHRVGLPENFGRRYRHELSGGQRQRVGIARALALSPKFVLADEIVSGLDVSTQAQILTLLEKLAAEMGLTVAFISHDLSVVRRLCRQVIVMRNGEIVEAGPTDALFAAPKHAYTRELIEAIPLPEIDPDWLDRVPARTNARARCEAIGEVIFGHAGRAGVRHLRKP
jgi:ABC-type oligopeptide transport system ATPase subunit